MSAPTTRIQRPAAPCAECGAPVRGAFCAACGQRAEVLRQPVHHFLRESFTEFFGLDGRVWRTFSALLFRPGRLTQAYMGGQRQRYLRPLRVYLTSTLLFFLILSVIDPVGKLDMGDSGRDPEDLVQVATLAARTDSVAAAGVAGMLMQGRRVTDSVRTAFRQRTAGDSSRGSEVAEILGTALAPALRVPDRDSLAASLTESDSSDVAEAALSLRRIRAQAALLHTMPPDSLVFPTDLYEAASVLYPDSSSGINGPSWLMRSKTVQQLNSGVSESTRREALTDLMRASIGKVPTVMFLLLPLFAFLLKGLYRRRGWYFAEHIVFGLHTHAFAFVGFTAITLAVWAAPKPVAKVATLVLLAAIPVYFVVAMKRVYGQGWGKTLLKVTVLAGAYSTVLLFGLIAASLLAAVVG